MARTALIIPAASVLLATGALAAEAGGPGAGAGHRRGQRHAPAQRAGHRRARLRDHGAAGVEQQPRAGQCHRGAGRHPGVTALDRQNYAQDTQLSIRGFGARSTFGVRSLRIYADGIPASMPDGQGQLSHFSMLGGDRMQVMRGPFSALYGNSSGGVVQMWSRPGTEDGPTRRARHLRQLRCTQSRRADAGRGRARWITTSRHRASRPTATAITAPRSAT